MKKISLENAEKAIWLADYQAGCGEFLIDSQAVYGSDFVPLGNDFFQSEKGIAGPSGGNPERTFLPFGNPAFDRWPYCPVCHGDFYTSDSPCLCEMQGIKDFYGV